MAKVVRYFNFEKEAPGMLMQFQIEGEKLGHILEAKIKSMAVSGMGEKAILQTLRNDLYNGGPIFGALRNAFRSTAGKAIDDIAQLAIKDEFADELLESDDWEWITTSGNPCPDCMPRHQVVKTYEEWEEIGLPRSGFSVCDKYCKCVLLPAPMIQGDKFKEPVKVIPIRQFRQDFQERLKTDTALQAQIAEHKANVKAARKQLKNKSVATKKQL